MSEQVGAGGALVRSTHALAREAVDREIEYARAANHHRSVRVVTLERVLAITDAKTDALKEIHRICNRLLDTEGVADFARLKYIRDLASATWPAIAKAEGRS